MTSDEAALSTIDQDENVPIGVPLGGPGRKEGFHGNGGGNFHYISSRCRAGLAGNFRERCWREILDIDHRRIAGIHKTKRKLLNHLLDRSIQPGVWRHNLAGDSEAYSLSYAFLQRRPAKYDPGYVYRQKSQREKRD